MSHRYSRQSAAPGELIAGPVRISGSSAFELRLGGIQVALPLELHIDGQAIVTSPVRRIELQRAAS